MAGYNDTRNLIIEALMGRQAGTEIQPEKHQAYALNMLDYIRSVELASSSTLAGLAEESTVPIQPNKGKVCYIAGVGEDRTVTFSNFINNEGNPITITSGNSGLLIILFWNLNYWEFHTYETSIDSYNYSSNYNYGYNIKRTYSSIAEMQADTVLIGDNRLPINIGDIVSVVNTTTPTENGLYSRIDSGWQFQTSVNLTIEQVRSQNTTTVPSSKLLDDELAKKVDKVTGSRLLTALEATKLSEAVTITTFEAELSKKVNVSDNERLITLDESDKLASAATTEDLESYSLKNIEGLEEVLEVPKEENKYIKFFDKVVGEEKKISLQNFILSVSNLVYPTARTLVGDKNGMNETFISEYNYIAGSEKLNINGCIYYPNSGFYNEAGKIILSGAPIPEAGDFMFLEAIYLD